MLLQWAWLRAGAIEFTGGRYGRVSALGPSVVL